MASWLESKLSDVNTYISARSCLERSIKRRFAPTLNASPLFSGNGAIVHRCIADHSSSLQCSTKQVFESEFQASVAAKIDCFVVDSRPLGGQESPTFHILPAWRGSSQCGSGFFGRRPNSAPLTSLSAGVGSRIYCSAPSPPPNQLLPPPTSLMLGIASSRQEGQGSHYWPRSSVLGAK